VTGSLSQPPDETTASRSAAIPHAVLKIEETRGLQERDEVGGRYPAGHSMAGPIQMTKLPVSPRPKLE